jgi:hypothetical protein
MILRMGVPSLAGAAAKPLARTFCCRHYNRLGSRQTTGGNPMPAAFFVIRAIVSDASKRAAFDKWYETEHLPDAVKAFG